MLILIGRYNILIEYRIAIGNRDREAGERERRKGQRREGRKKDGRKERRCITDSRLKILAPSHLQITQLMRPPSLQFFSRKKTESAFSPTSFLPLPSWDTPQGPLLEGRRSFLPFKPNGTSEPFLTCGRRPPLPHGRPHVKN